MQLPARIYENQCDPASPREAAMHCLAVACYCTIAQLDNSYVCTLPVYVNWCMTPATVKPPCHCRAPPPNDIPKVFHLVSSCAVAVWPTILLWCASWVAAVACGARVRACAHYAPCATNKHPTTGHFHAGTCCVTILQDTSEFRSPTIEVCRQLQGGSDIICVTVIPPLEACLLPHRAGLSQYPLIEALFCESRQLRAPCKAAYTKLTAPLCVVYDDRFLYN